MKGSHGGMRVDGDLGAKGDEMTTILMIIALAIGAVVLLNLMSDKKTKLFRRVWSSEALRHQSSHIATSQNEAITELIQRYGIVAMDDKGLLRSSTAQLLADAATFDMKNPRNMGVQIAPVIARELRKRFPNIAD